MKKVFLLMVIFLLVTGFAPSELTGVSRSYLLMDADTGEIVESHNVDRAIEIASVTKLMTYLLVAEALDRGDIRLDQSVVATADVLRGGATYSLKPGNEYTVRELVQAMIVLSANDATTLLAKTVAGTEGEFTKRMNRRAREIGLDTAYFYNSTGLPIYPQDVQNKMSTRDLAKMSRYLLFERSEILQLSSITEIPVGENGEWKPNTNPLLGAVKGVDGLKTGSTRRAGFCLVWTMKFNGEKHRMVPSRWIGINMGFADIKRRDEFTLQYANYVRESYAKRIMVSKGYSEYSLYVPKAKKPLVPVFPDETFVYRGRDYSELEIETRFDENIALPIEKNTVVGEIVIRNASGKTLFKTSLKVHEKIR